MSRLVSLSFAGLALAFATHAAADSPGLNLAVGNFNAADWSLIQITDDGPSSANMVIDANLGNPGSHWVISYVTPASPGLSSSTNRLGAFYTGMAYDPAQSGALGKLAFSADLRGLSSSFAFDTLGSIRPALLQGGVTYTVAGSELVTGKSMIQPGYLSQQWSFDAAAADWIPPVAGSLQRPDFGAGAAPIYVGFRYTLATSCNSANGCTGGSAFLSLDNFSATLTPVMAPVPEPSAWMLLAAGLGLLALRRRA
ncbi:MULTISPECIES: PEP-CTERM sorting domain-containing protein [unclassified Roseateles]|uniref:PEP-CTERM sorting domain-containing protein n=1 Tax=unclassified Roseateles TaxID=2626991 RepID=UPI0007002CC6|nr:MULTISPECIES: PEP-CTERM sorting domain-containing protein [unclassified Roseateles]KQW44600.1 hypothetical protein ASC81_13450 [Pelomonas sp. Root405]KRA69959.1 hypothetical protein ASD88_17610 [Pelomonas sp. Root662]